MDVSKHLSEISGSMTAQIFATAKELEQQGNQIIHLEIGQPDFQPPDSVKKAVTKALNSGETTYTVSRGRMDLRSAVVNYYQANYSFQINPKNEVIITSGAKIAIFGAIWSVTNPGDNVLILNPSWVSYADIVLSLGAEPRYIPVDLDFNFDIKILLDKIDNKTRVLIVNSPSNPTGAIISYSNLKKLYEICAQRNILILSDEIYNDYVYDGIHSSLMEIPGWIGHGVVINGFSKTFSMTGFRLGYALGASWLIDEINKVIQLTSSCPVNFVQSAGIVALENVSTMQQFIQKEMIHKRNLVNEQFLDLSIKFHPPKGAIYAWIKVPTNNSIDFAQKLLRETGVAVTPGKAFGPDGEGFIRICFATNTSQLKIGINKIGNFINSI